MNQFTSYIDSVADSMENESRFEITHWDYKSIVWMSHDGDISNIEL